MARNIRHLTIDLDELDDGSITACVRIGHTGDKASKEFTDWEDAADGLYELLSASVNEDGEIVTEATEDEDTEDDWRYRSGAKKVDTLAQVLQDNVDGRFPNDDCEIVAFQLIATGPTSYEVAGYPRNPDVGPLRTDDDYDSLDDALYYFRNVVANEWRHYMPAPAEDDEVH